MNKLVVLTMLLVLLTPVIAISSAQIPEESQISPEGWNSSVGVVAGDTFYYTINEFTLPAAMTPSGATIPDITGNQLVLKVSYVDNSFEYNSSLTGVFVYFSIGFKFTKDTTFNIDMSPITTSVVVPAGAATPSIGVGGKPHFDPDMMGPTVWVLNNDWADHESKLSAMGFTVTQTATTFTATAINGTGTFSVEYRKSDGVLTHLLLDDIVFMGLDATDFTIEFTLAKKEQRPLTLTVGQIIYMDADVMDITLSGSGTIYDQINQTDFSQVKSTLNGLVGKHMMKFTVLEIYGTNYVLKLEGYDMASDSLNVIGNMYYQGFLGTIPLVEPPKLSTSSADEFFPGMGPVLTPDWDIYEGYMILGNTILGVYINEMLTLVGPPAEDAIIHDVEMTMGFSKKSSFYYFQQNMIMDLELNTTYSGGPLAFGALGAYTAGMRMNVDEKFYMAFHQSGVFAGMRMKMALSVTSYDDTGFTNQPTGTVTVNVDFKLKNPDYNAPDNFEGAGFIPGFEWIVAIPTLIGLAALGLIARKKK